MTHPYEFIPAAIILLSVHLGIQDDKIYLLRQPDLERLFEGQREILTALEEQAAKQPTETPIIEPESMGPATEGPKNAEEQVEDPWIAAIGQWIDQLGNWIIVIAGLGYAGVKGKQKYKEAKAAKND